MIKLHLSLMSYIQTELWKNGEERYDVEVKCPLVSCECKINPVTVPYITGWSMGSQEFTLDPDHSHYYQIQGQMLCTDTFL